MKAPFLIFVLLLIAAALQIVYYYPRLPDTVASHFDGRGNPNGWSSKTTFFAIDAGVMVLFVFVFLIMPRSFPRFSTARMNLPNKDYWLAPERRAETFAFIQRQLLWFGVFSLLLLVSVMQGAIHANLPEAGEFPSTAMWIALAAYGVILVSWMVRLFLTFRRTG